MRATLHLTLMIVTLLMSTMKCVSTSPNQQITRYPQIPPLRATLERLGARTYEIEQLEGIIYLMEDSIKQYERGNKTLLTRQYMRQFAQSLKYYAYNLRDKYLKNYNNVVIGQGSTVLGKKNVAIGKNILIEGDRNYIFNDPTEHPYPMKGTGWIRGVKYDVNVEDVEKFITDPYSVIIPQDKLRKQAEQQQLKREAAVKTTKK